MALLAAKVGMQAMVAYAPALCVWKRWEEYGKAGCVGNGPNSWTKEGESCRAFGGGVL